MTKKYVVVDSNGEVESKYDDKSLAEIRKIALNDPSYFHGNDEEYTVETRNDYPLDLVSQYFDDKVESQHAHYVIDENDNIQAGCTTYLEAAAKSDVFTESKEGDFFGVSHENLFGGPKTGYEIKDSDGNVEYRTHSLRKATEAVSRFEDEFDEDYFFSEVNINHTDDEDEQSSEDDDYITPPAILLEEISTENSDETDTDDSNTSMNYNFINNDDNTDNEQQTEDSFAVRKWGLGDHSTASNDEKDDLTESIEETMDEMDGDVDNELMDVLADAKGLVETATLNRFECPLDDCGLGHSHSDSKHDIRSAFNVTKSFANGTLFCPYCHCGVNELAMLMEFFSYIDEPVFADQHEFEGVLELEPEVINEVYRRYMDDDASLDTIIANIAVQHGVSESEVVPLGLRDELKTFIDRRVSIQRAANSAPIAQETRNTIEEAREELSELTSE